MTIVNGPRPTTIGPTQGEGDNGSSVSATEGGCEARRIVMGPQAPRRN
jgi:hypothetical protein